MSKSKDKEAEDRKPSGKRKKGLLGALFALLRGVLYFLGIAWAGGAILFDGPFSSGKANTYLAIVYLLLALVFVTGLPRPAYRFLGWVLVVGVVLGPWLTIRPSHDREWQSGWEELGWTERSDDGERITIHNFRDFTYRGDGEVGEARWEERTVRLSNLRGLDYFHVAFGGQLLAHPILSFDFGPDGHVAFSIEVRREDGESFSPVAGLYKTFELIYLVDSEEDFVGLRTNHRKEPVRLYRATYSPERVREMFLETVKAMNAIKDKPRFYNTITANCTTSLVTQAPPEKRARFDYRILINGQLEELLYERKAVATDGLSFPDLVNKASINPAALKHGVGPGFSERIREGRPGF